MSLSQQATRGTAATSRSRKGLSVLLLVILVLLNGESHVRQYSEPTAFGGPPTELKDEETAIIITSSWIPTHPSTRMLDTVLNSTRRLVGLSPAAPVIITVDNFQVKDVVADPTAMAPKLAALEEYTENLLAAHLIDPRIHVVPAIRHGNIGGSVLKALNLLAVHYPTVRYVYYLQHDFYFLKDIDHTALIRAMDAHPGKINYVRFAKRHQMQTGCGDDEPIACRRTAHASDGAAGNGTVPALILSPTASYSDNNHLVNFTWYKTTIASIISMERAPEDPLQGRANNACRDKNKPSMGLYLYPEMTIGHLDGRNTAAT